MKVKKAKAPSQTIHSKSKSKEFKGFERRRAIMVQRGRNHTRKMTLTQCLNNLRPPTLTISLTIPHGQTIQQLTLPIRICTPLLFLSTHSEHIPEFPALAFHLPMGLRRDHPFSTAPITHIPIAVIILVASLTTLGAAITRIPPSPTSGTTIASIMMVSRSAPIISEYRALNSLSLSSRLSLVPRRRRRDFGT